MNMSPGIPARALPPVVLAQALRAIRTSGGFTFAEDPTLGAPDARIIWHAGVDPGAIEAIAAPACLSDPDRIDPVPLRRWLTLVEGVDGEHAVLSDGWRRIRIDIARGSFAADAPVILHYRLSGVAQANRKLLPLHRLIHIVRYGVFARSLFPLDTRMPRQLLILRVHDARAAGASHRQIADTLFPGGDAGCADSLRSRVRRLAQEARRMASGGWRSLLRGKAP